MEDIILNNKDELVETRLKKNKVTKEGGEIIELVVGEVEKMEPNERKLVNELEEGDQIIKTGDYGSELHPKTKGKLKPIMR